MSQSQLTVLGLASFIAMLISANIYPPAVTLNIICCVLAGYLGYRGQIAAALFLACVNVLAIVFSPVLNGLSIPSLKAILILVLCTMFIGIALGQARHKV